MTNAEPTSTKATTTESTSTEIKTDRAESAVSEPSHIAVSEENLAALLRATRDAPEGEALEPVAAVEEVSEPPAAEVPAVSAPTQAVESRRALFASVKEHRSEILRTAAAPEAIERVLERPVERTVERPIERTVERTVERPVERPIAQREYPAARLPVEAAAIQITLPKAQPAIAATPTTLPTPSRNSIVLAVIAGVLVVAAGIVFLWPKSHAPKAPAVAVAAPKVNAPLQVLAEPLGNGLTNVRWNADSSVIAEARDGRLVITEHDKAPRIMALDAAQLKIGHLTYQSTAESIQFDLEVNDRSGGVAKESILSLTSPAAMAPQAPRDPVAAVKAQVVQAAAQAKVPATVPPIVQIPVEVAQQSPAKARAFVPPTAQKKSEQAAIIDAPPTLANGPAAPLGVALPARLTPLSPPPPVAVPQQIRVESNLQAANLIKRVVPVYPLLARSAGIQGAVRFTALIGKDGTIQNLKLIAGPPPLVDAATNAVKRWLYRPTLLNGQPVEVITQINVNFTINGETR